MNTVFTTVIENDNQSLINRHMLKYDYCPVPFQGKPKFSVDETRINVEWVDPSNRTSQRKNFNKQYQGEPENFIITESSQNQIYNTEQSEDMCLLKSFNTL